MYELAVSQRSMTFPDCNTSSRLHQEMHLKTQKFTHESNGRVDALTFTFASANPCSQDD
jgi:hypothetical protein